VLKARRGIRTTDYLMRAVRCKVRGEGCHPEEDRDYPNADGEATVAA
jgi:hypothetical protein